MEIHHQPPSKSVTLRLEVRRPQEPHKDLYILDRSCSATHLGSAISAMLKKDRVKVQEQDYQPSY